MSEKTDRSLVVVVILVVPLVAARQGKKGDFGRSQGRCSCRASCVIEKKVEGEEEVDRAREDLVGDRKEKEIGSSADSFISDQHPSNTFYSPGFGGCVCLAQVLGIIQGEGDMCGVGWIVRYCPFKKKCAGSGFNGSSR